LKIKASIAQFLALEQGILSGEAANSSCLTGEFNRRLSKFLSCDLYGMETGDHRIEAG
jgi:hypothetical protein